MGRFVASYDENQYETKVVNGKIEVWEKEETAKEWVCRTFSNYMKDIDTKCTWIYPYAYVIDNCGNVAKAKCSPNDSFSSNTGIAIAYARLKGLPIHPDFICNRKKKEVKEKTKEVKQDFNIGDTVEALPSSHNMYLITRDGWRGVVVNKFGDGSIKVRELGDGSEYFVFTKYFKVIKEAGRK